MLDRYAEEIRARLQSGPFRRDVPPLDRLTRFLAELGVSLREEQRKTGCLRGCPIGNIVSELATRDAAARDAAARALDVFRDVFADVLREAVAEGSLPAGADVGVGADALVAYLQGLAVFGKAYRDPTRLARLAALVPALCAATPVSPKARSEPVPAPIGRGRPQPRLPRVGRG